MDIGTDIGTPGTDVGSDIGTDIGTDVGLDTGTDTGSVSQHSALVGIVIDETGSPVPGVTVTALGQTTTSGSDGLFRFDGLTTSVARWVVTARKTGLFPASLSVAPAANGISSLQLKLLKAEPFLLTDAGGEVLLETGAKVEFPAGSFATKAGTPISGNVQVLVRHVSPDRADYSAIFPGGPEAQRLDGSEAMLISVGVIFVELYDMNGEKVFLAPGKPARLVFPVPESMRDAVMQEGTPMAAIPLWYFDEELGLWMEQGLASFDGVSYIGEVTHFTPWNLDLPAQRVDVTGRVVCGNQPLGGVALSLGEFIIQTELDGTFAARIPSSFPIDVRIRDLMVPTRDWDTVVMHLPGYTGGMTVALGDFGPSVCPIIVTGRMVDCEGISTQGVIYVGRSGATRAVPTDAEGRFEVRVPLDATFRLSGMSPWTGSVTPQDVIVPAVSGPIALGDLAACSTRRTCMFTDSPILPPAFNGNVAYLGTALSPDGWHVAVAAATLAGISCSILDVATWSSVEDLGPCTPSYDGTGLQWSPDGRSLLTSGGGGTMVFNLETGSQWRNDSLQTAFFKGTGTTLLALRLDPPALTKMLGVVPVNLNRTLVEVRAVDGSEVRSFSFTSANYIPNTMVLYGVRGEAALLGGWVSPGVAKLIVWSTTQDRELGRWDSSAVGSDAISFAGGTQLLVSQWYEKPGFEILDTLTGATTERESSIVVKDVAFAPDGNSVALGSLENDRYGITLFSFPGLMSLGVLPASIGSGPTQRNSLSFSADGRSLLMNQGYVLRVWDVASCLP